MDILADVAWQDIVLTIGQLFFVVAVWPMLRSAQKPPYGTSLAHGVILGTFGVTFTTLELWFSAASVMIVSGMWFWLAWQRYRSTRA